MILDITQITTIIKENPNKAILQWGRDYSTKLRRHMYGEGLEAHIQNIKGFEREEVTKLRKTYSKSNKDLFSRLGRPIDKVFSARGGAVYYNLTGEQDQRARSMAADVFHGYSIRKWIEVFWRPHMLDDPQGLLFLEIAPVQQASLLKAQGKSFVYPTYKPTSSIYDYLLKGSRLEYVVFKLTPEEKKANGFKDADQMFRIVDDAYDYYVKYESQEVTVMTQFTLRNYFGEVPAMTNSDIVNPQKENTFLSVFDDIIELAEDFLLDGSVKRIHKFRHGFPKYSEFADDCKECKGTRYVQGKECASCKGTGKSVMVSVSDVKLLNWPTKDEAVIMPDQVGGYVEPSATFHQISTEDLQTLEDTMNVTLWGHASRVQASGPSSGSPAGQTKTATEIQDEVKPEADRLFPISEMAEKRSKFILDAVIRLNIAMNYGGSSVNYGRRYMLEGADVLWDKYSKARSTGAPQNVLDSLLNEYYDANYQSDPVALQIAKKLVYVEPFVHYTAEKLKSLDVDPDDYKAKVYFSEWLATLNEAMLLSMSSDLLRQNLYEYASAKKLKAEPLAEPVLK